LIGPHRFNFAQASADAIACGAALQVKDVGEAATAAGELFEHPPRLCAMRAAALRFSQAHCGATARTMALVQRLMVLRKGC
jgi:3-deoxy-D-manno-octulosonic-acid transferase